MKRCFVLGLLPPKSWILGTTSLRLGQPDVKWYLAVAYLLARIVSLFARKADLEEKLAKFSLVAHG
jgi:hypothetical protein